MLRTNSDGHFWRTNIQADSYKYNEQVLLTSSVFLDYSGAKGRKTHVKQQLSSDEHISDFDTRK